MCPKDTWPPLPPILVKTCSMHVSLTLVNICVDQKLGEPPPEMKKNKKSDSVNQGFSS